MTNKKLDDLVRKFNNGEVSHNDYQKLKFDETSREREQFWALVVNSSKDETVRSLVSTAENFMAFLDENDLIDSDEVLSSYRDVLEGDTAYPFFLGVSLTEHLCDMICSCASEWTDGNEEWYEEIYKAEGHWMWPDILSAVAAAYVQENGVVVRILDGVCRY